MKSDPTKDMSQFDVINIQTNVSRNVLGAGRRCLVNTNGTAYFSIWAFQRHAPNFVCFKYNEC